MRTFCHCDMCADGCRSGGAAFRRTVPFLDVSPRQMLCRWLGVLSLSLLFLFWLGLFVPRGGPLPATKSSGRRGYRRISPDRTGQFLETHCNHCALVSSSGQMLGAATGDEIDQTECVIRMNNAPTRGFEEDVGSRTSVRVVSHTSVPLLLKNELYYFKQSANTTYVIWGPEKNMRQDGRGVTFNALLKLATKYLKAKIYMVTRDKIQYCDNVFQKETGLNRMKTGAFLSTGFFSMILAMDMCDSISVYGMIDDNYCNRAHHRVVPYHYYDQKKISECKMYTFHQNKKLAGHRYITEKAIYAKWATRHKIQFKHPAWRL